MKTQFFQNAPSPLFYFIKAEILTATILPSCKGIFFCNDTAFFRTNTTYFVIWIVLITLDNIHLTGKTTYSYCNIIILNYSLKISYGASIIIQPCNFWSFQYFKLFTIINERTKRGEYPNYSGTNANNVCYFLPNHNSILKRQVVDVKGEEGISYVTNAAGGRGWFSDLRRRIIAIFVKKLLDNFHLIRLMHLTM